MFTKLEMIDALKAAEKKGCGHYVYGLLRGDDGRIFYIGKGAGLRFTDHEKEASSGRSSNNHKVNIIRKHGVSGYVLFSVHDEAKDAFLAEMDLIAEYGIENLANIGHGGEGQDPEFASAFTKKMWADPNSNIRKATSTDEYRKKLGAAIKEAQNRPEVKAKRAESMAKVMPQISAKLREHYKDPEARYKCGNGGRGRTHSDAEKAKRNAAVKAAYENPELRKLQSDTLKAISSTPEMREKRSAAAKVRWGKDGAKERASAIAKEVGARPEVKAKLSESSKRQMQNPERKAKMISALLAHNQKIKGTGKDRSPKYATDAERSAARAEAMRERMQDPELKAAMSEKAKVQVADPETRRKLTEGRKAQAAKIRALRAEYCALRGITSPGKNFCNIDSADFNQWVNSRC